MDERGVCGSGSPQCSSVSRGGEAAALDKERLLWLAGRYLSKSR